MRALLTKKGEQHTFKSSLDAHSGRLAVELLSATFAACQGRSGLDAHSGRLAVELTKKCKQHTFKAKETKVVAEALSRCSRARTAAALNELVDMPGDGCRVSIAKVAYTSSLWPHTPVA